MFNGVENVGNVINGWPTYTRLSPAQLLLIFCFCWMMTTDASDGGGATAAEAVAVAPTTTGLLIVLLPDADGCRALQIDFARLILPVLLACLIFFLTPLVQCFPSSLPPPIFFFFQKLLFISRNVHCHRHRHIYSKFLSHLLNVSVYFNITTLNPAYFMAI
uniref:Secreted protein n=1 Tax=Syphacia muris TaxID=451379 RepID=A0A0N5AR49_9BILA